MVGVEKKSARSLPNEIPKLYVQEVVLSYCTNDKLSYPHPEQSCISLPGAASDNRV